MVFGFSKKCPVFVCLNTIKAKRLHFFRLSHSDLKLFPYCQNFWLWKKLNLSRANRIIFQSLIHVESFGLHIVYFSVNYFTTRSASYENYFRTHDVSHVSSDLPYRSSRLSRRERVANHSETLKSLRIISLWFSCGGGKKTKTKYLFEIL